MTPLHKAAERNSKDVAEILIRSGADVNARDKVNTALAAVSDICISHLLYQCA